jgi:hypothetical protein
MQKRGHLILAGIICAAFIFFTGWLNLNWFSFSLTSIIAIIIITAIYSLLPDIDQKNSTMTWIFFGIGIIGLIFGITELIFNLTLINPTIILSLSTLLLVFTFLSANLFEHRGIVHTVEVGLLSIIPVYFIFHSLGLCILAYISWHSHLLGDGYIFKIK